MGKKIALSIFGGIAAIGLLVMVVGLFMGGRPGGYTVKDGNFVYQSYNETVRLGRAPKGWDNRWFLTAAGAYNPENYHETDPEAISAAFGEAKTPALPADAQEAKRFDIDISAGYLTVVQGDTFSVKVNGPLECTVELDGDGTCEVKSDYDTSRITTNPLNGKARFYMDGKDVTTEFLVTVPAERQMVDANLSMGVMTVTGITADEGDFSLNVGTMAMENCAVKVSEISTDVGAVTVKGFKGDSCHLVVRLGNIDFQGSVSDTLEVDCDLGHVSATLPRPETYGEQTKVGLGSITIDNHHVTGVDGHSEGNHNSRPYFDLQCDLGSIEIIFE